ncbi:MAG: glutamine amidotransferase [Anaerolineae bacterium SM23_ 63]|nr:MAG: glutamine amidotransferase [Anaerolineae bacterium SM23_ 63]HEY46322.1 pyridoxal 5'-phosphate synthase glutaminase subunit PdxT [Anaerolineae bacterium]
MKVGILALQGDFAEHIASLRPLGVETVEVRLPEQLKDLEGLIIPGGESTTIGKLATSYHLIEPLRRFSQDRPIWGTCAGAIFLSNDTRRQQPLLNVMDITVERNAFGRQVDSFETELSIPALEDPDKPYRAIFIRAPIIENVGEGVEVLARLPKERGDGDRIVAARQGHLLATSFHPELAGDDRFHRYFLGLAKG